MSPNIVEFKGKTFLVTGASSGIGRDIACLLSTLGAKVLAVGRSLDQLNQTASVSVDGRIIVEPFDLNNLDAIPLWLLNLSDKYGKIDGVVHSAGIQKTVAIRNINSALIDEVLRINVSAAIMLAKGFCHKQVRADHGSMVIISSVMGLVGAPGLSVYSASKGAVIAATRALALELAKDSIRVNCVAPGYVNDGMYRKIASVLPKDILDRITGMHPLGLGEPRDVSNAVVYLLSPLSKWVTGATFTLDGGYTLT
jgi:3-oxoacyl-[acyl-carrier protein] reductase